MADKSSNVRLASRIVLGIELQHWKQDLGYQGAGTYLSHRDKSKPVKRLTWPQYCLAVAGISERSATLYYQCSEALKTRLRCLGKSGSAALLRKLEKKPSTMTAAVRADMLQKIITLGLTVGETQEQLLREYRGVHLPDSETNHAKSGESGKEWKGMSLAELSTRYPDEADASTYAIAKISGSSEESARLLVIVTKELRSRRAKLGR